MTVSEKVFKIRCGDMMPHLTVALLNNEFFSIVRQSLLVQYLSLSFFCREESRQVLFTRLFVQFAASLQAYRLNILIFLLWKYMQSLFWMLYVKVRQLDGCFRQPCQVCAGYRNYVDTVCQIHCGCRSQLQQFSNFLLRIFHI